MNESNLTEKFEPHEQECSVNDSISSNDQVTNSAFEEHSQNQSNLSKKKFPKKLLIGISIITAVIIAAAIAIWFFFIKNNTNYVVYVKDDEIFFSDYSKKGTFQLTSTLLDDSDSDWDDSMVYALGLLTFLSENGTIFYCDEINDDGATLFCRNSKKPDEEALKIDTGISSYFFASDDGKYVVYLKNDTLYEYSVKKAEKTKIASEVEGFFMSRDGKSLLYYKDDGSLYYKKQNYSDTKLDSDIENLEYISTDFSRFYYIKDENLYLNTPDCERTKIASEIYSVMSIYDSGEVYYAVENESTDDLELYYYDGVGTSTKITDSIRYVECVSRDTTVLIYSEYDDDYNESYHICIKAKSDEIDESEIEAVLLSNDGKSLYYITNVSSEDYTGDLYRIDIDDNRLGKEKLYASDVYVNNVTLLKDGTIVYCKDFEENEDDKSYSYTGHAELYTNEKLIDYDVYVNKYSLNNLVYREETNTLIYFTDWNCEKECGTLKMFNKKAEKISDDVHSFSITADEKIVYLKDYSTKYSRGELYIHSNSKSEKIDEDVSYIIPVFDIYDLLMWII